MKLKPFKIYAMRLTGESVMVLGFCQPGLVRVRIEDLREIEVLPEELEEIEIEKKIGPAGVAVLFKEPGDPSAGEAP